MPWRLVAGKFFGMKASEVAALEGRLDAFVGEMTGFLGRKDRQHWARTYLVGLLLDGERKSVEAMAARLGVGARDGQALQGFVSESPWSCDRLQAQMARHAARLWPRAHAWILDETSFPKAGRHSVGVGHQYCGALGKLANCQVAVSLHYAAGTLEAPVSAALGWRLFLPRAWTDDSTRRQQAGVPESVTYRSKHTLALELVDEALARGLPKAPVLADSDYGDDYSWRAALRQKGVGYGVAVEPPRQGVDARAGRLAPAPPPVGPRPGTRCLSPSAWTRSPASCPRGPGASSPGGRARADPCRGVLHGWRSGRATATPSASIKPGRAPRVALVVEWRPGQRRSHRLLVGAPGRRRENAHPQSPGRPGAGTLARRAGLPGVEGGTRAGPLRGPLVAGLAPPRQP